jgi:xanthine dehydrogenase accessory factor
MATVVERQGSAPSTPGQKLILCQNGHVLGTVGGGAVEQQVLTELARLMQLRGPQTRMVSFRLGAELGMCCGGRVELMLESIGRPYPCYVVGAGHVSTALRALLEQLGFRVLVSDSREAYAADSSTVEPGAVVWGEFDEVGRSADIAGACLVMTHDHQLDQAAIEWAIRAGFAFVGGVGSRAKAERTRQRLAAKGVAAADIGRVRMPLGMECSARTPQELAVSIAAELIQVRARAVAAEAAQFTAVDATFEAHNLHGWQLEPRKPAPATRGKDRPSSSRTRPPRPQ